MSVNKICMLFKKTCKDLFKDYIHVLINSNKEIVTFYFIFINAYALVGDILYFLGIMFSCLIIC